MNKLLVGIYGEDTVEMFDCLRRLDSMYDRSFDIAVYSNNDELLKEVNKYYTDSYQYIGFHKVTRYDDSIRSMIRSGHEYIYLMKSNMILSSSWGNRVNKLIENNQFDMIIFNFEWVSIKKHSIGSYSLPLINRQNALKGAYGDFRLDYFNCIFKPELVKYTGHINMFSIIEPYIDAENVMYTDELEVEFIDKIPNLIPESYPITNDLDLEISNYYNDLRLRYNRDLESSKILLSYFDIIISYINNTSNIITIRSMEVDKLCRYGILNLTKGSL